MSFNRTYCNCNNISGPFYIIGDCHGCRRELAQLLGVLGFELDGEGFIWAPAHSEKAQAKLVWVGDLCDRGPQVAQVLEPLIAAWRCGPPLFPLWEGLDPKSLGQALELYRPGAPRFGLDSERLQPPSLRKFRPLPKRAGWKPVPLLAVLGNHEFRLLRVMEGRNVRLETHGLPETLRSLRAAWEGPYTTLGGKVLERYPFSYLELAGMLASLPHYLSLDGGKLLVSHAGLAQHLQGTIGEKARHFCLFGDTTGKFDERGFPERRPWEEEYRGPAIVVYGHTPNSQVKVCNGAFNVDTGCVFGGQLSALHYPSMGVASIAAGTAAIEA